MVDRSVVVRLIADNASFNSAMAQSANAIQGIGRTAESTASSTTAAFGRIKTAAVALIGVAAVKTGEDLLQLKENAQVAFTVMLDGAEKARSKIAEIEKFSAQTVIGLDTWIRGAQLLRAYGIEAEKLLPTLQSIADASAASGQGAAVVDRIILALGQINSKGRLMAQEVLQLTEAGIPALAILSEAMGMTTLQVQKQMEKGLIDSASALEMLQNGIQKRFGGLGEAMTNTLTGSFMKFKTQLQQGGAALLTPLVDVQKAALTTGSVFVKSFGTATGDLFTGLVPVMSVVLTPLTLISKGLSALSGPAMAAAGALGLMMLVHGPLNRFTTSMMNFGRSLGDSARYQRTLAAGSIFNGSGVQQLSRYAAATETLRQRFGGLAGAGRSMVAMLGGPLGIALIGAAVLMSIWGKAQRKAAEDEAAHVAALAQLKDTLDKVSGAVTAATTASLIASFNESKDGAASLSTKLTELGSSSAEAAAAVIAGGTTLDDYRKKLAAAAVATDPALLTKHSELIEAMIGGEDELNAYYNRLAVQRNTDVENVRTHEEAIMKEGRIALDGLAVLATGLGTAAQGVSQGATEIRKNFTDTADAAAILAGVAGGDVVTALDAAKDSGGSVEAALAKVGIEGEAAAAVMAGMGDLVVKGAGDFHIMAGAAGAGAAGIADMTKEATASAKALMTAVAAAQAFRQAVTNAVTSFVNPVAAWDTAKEKAQPKEEKKAKKTATRDDPVVKALSAATDAGKKARDQAVKSIDKEKDAALKAAKAQKEAVSDRSKADTRMTKDAEELATARVKIANDEAAELKKIADKSDDDIKDATDKLAKANFDLAAAIEARHVAELGLAGSDAQNREQWQRALTHAIDDETAARGRQGDAAVNAAKVTNDAANAQAASAKATDVSTTAESDLAAAKAAAATATEVAQDRNEAADDAYQAASEAINARATADNEATQARYDELLEQKKAAEDAARASTSAMAEEAVDDIDTMVTEVEPSLQQWKDMLQKQKDDQTAWATNMTELTKKVPADIAQFFIESGPAMAGAVAQMNGASQAEIDAMIPLIRASMPGWNAAMVQTLLAGIPGTNSALAQLGDEGMASLLAQLNEADADIPAIFEKFGIHAQQSVDQFGAIVYTLTVDTKPAEDNTTGFFGRVADKWRAISAGLMPYSTNNYGQTHEWQGAGTGGYADGGWIRGGSGTRDDVPILAMGGEFMVNKSAAKANAQWLQHINHGGAGYTAPAPMAASSTTVVPMPMPAGPSGSQYSITTHSYYPQAEPTSVTVNRALAYAAVLGDL